MISLKALNSFGIDVKAKALKEITSLGNLIDLYSSGFFRKANYLVLGGGSNILFRRDFDGVVLLNRIPGLKVLREDENHIQLEIGGGLVWHDVVMHCVKNNWWGIENLSLIPGCVGAAPIQNIGAYGVELKDVFVSLEFFDFESGETQTFSLEACDFAYRHSIFKGPLKGRGMITKVVLQLSKSPNPRLSYGAIQAELEKRNIFNPNIKDISDVVISIRQSKLPNPAEIGNGGSFFKNPVIEETKFSELKSNFKELPSYPAPRGVKIPAAWLIDQCGWKGYREGDAGCHKNQALVLVNYGNASGEDIERLALRIQESVEEKFGVSLEMEVNLV